MEQVPIEDLRKCPYVLYFSNKSKPSLNLLQKIKQCQEISYLFEYINIDFPGALMHNIRSIPSIIENDTTAYSGKGAFEFVENEISKSVMYSNSFNPHYSDQFSNINEEPIDHTFLDLQSSNIKSEPVKDENSALIESIMEKRKNEIPQPIQRV